MWTTGAGRAKDELMPVKQEHYYLIHSPWIMQRWCWFLHRFMCHQQSCASQCAKAKKKVSFWGNASRAKIFFFDWNGLWRGQRCVEWEKTSTNVDFFSEGIMCNHPSQITLFFQVLSHCAVCSQQVELLKFNAISTCGSPSFLLLKKTFLGKWKKQGVFIT